MGWETCLKQQLTIRTLQVISSLGHSRHSEQEMSRSRNHLYSHRQHRNICDVRMLLYYDGLLVQVEQANVITRIIYLI